MDVEILRENHSINKESIFYVIGGHSGDISDRIINKFDCFTDIFEPSEYWFNFLVDKYKNNPKVRVFNFGFANEEKECKLYHHGDKEGYQGDGSNIYVESDKFEVIKLKKASDWIKDNNIESVNLIEFNCEGAEFEIIKDLFDNNLLNKINTIQVQFHKINNHEQLLSETRERLMNTHNQSWNIPNIFECWDLK